MKIKYFCKNYCNVDAGCNFRRVLEEVREFFEAMFKLDFKEMKEEFHDVVSFVQMWLYFEYKVDGKLWRLGMPSFNKFISRRKVWSELYVFCGLDKNVSTYCGNCKRKAKVVSQLGKFGVSEKKALEAYDKIVRKI